MLERSLNKMPARAGLGRRLLTRALATAASIPYFQRYFNGFGYGSPYTSRGPGMDREYLRWAAGLGDIGSSWIVQAYRKYLSLGLSAPRLMLIKEDLENQQIEVTRHAALDRLKRPNDFCTWRQFVEAFAYNWIQGTHYVRKQRDKTQPGSPIVALWPEPKECVRPVVTPSPGGKLDEYLSGYEVYRDGTGTWYPVAVEDMIQFADGFDPKTREGRNWIRSVSAELYTDKGISNHRARMVANGLMKPVVLGVGSKSNAPNAEQLKVLQQFAEDRLADPNTNVLLMSGNISDAGLQHDLGSDGLARLCKPSEEHFAAVAQVSVISLLFAAGADVSTYSNVETMTRRDFRQVIVPTLDYIAEVLTLFFLVEYATIEQANGKRLRFTFDYSEVPQMQRDKKIDCDWTTRMFIAGGLKHREWREQMGYPGGEDKYIWEIPGLKAKLTGAAAGTSGDPALDAPPQSAVPTGNNSVRRLLMSDGLWHPVPRDTDGIVVSGRWPVAGGAPENPVADETSRRVM